MEIPKNKRSNKYNPVHKKMHELWRSMMARCYYPASGSYHNYGAIGITVCDEWQTYDGFLSTIDTIPGYNLNEIIYGNLQLDKDALEAGNTIYGPDTCMFLTPSDNCGNKRNNKMFVAVNIDTYEVHITKNREKFCREHDLDTSTVWRMLTRYKTDKHRLSHIYKGWTFQYLDEYSIERIPKRRIFEATNIDTGEIITFHNITQFAAQKNINKSSITACLKGRQKRVGRWTIRELEPINYKDSTTIERQLEAYRAHLEQTE